MNKYKKFLVMMLMMAASQNIDADKKSDIASVDDHINAVRTEIAAIREKNARTKERRMNRNADYKYVRNNSGRIDSLRKENEDILRRATAEVRSKNAWVLMAMSRDMFSQYADNPKIRTLADIYDFNLREIKKFEKRKERADEFVREIKYHHDSIMIARIDSCQHVLDSLLTHKMELLR